MSLDPEDSTVSKIDLVLRSYQSPGDGVMLTAAVRDLHRCCPGRYRTAVSCAWPDLWAESPYLDELDHADPRSRILDMHYPLIHQSNQLPYHVQHGYCQYLGEQLGERIVPTRWGGDIHLSPDERLADPPHHAEHGLCRYWLLVSGGKQDFTAKWPDPHTVQTVVDQTRDQIPWIQVGEAAHHHPRIVGAVDLVGRTTLRELILLMHHADGVLCPVTLAMHLAAAVPTRPGRPQRRACVVLAGGRESPSWEAYPWHQYLHSVGQMDCCSSGGCWKSRCHRIGDGDPKDHEGLCVRPVPVSETLNIAQCQTMIRPDTIMQAILAHYRSGHYTWPRTL